MQWEASQFQRLTIDRLFDVLELRVNVFVVEQQCAYPELDAYDRHVDTRHLLGMDATGQLVSYVRILPAGLRHPEVSFGRFVVKREARGNGLGRQLMERTLKEIQCTWPGNAIRISAQDYLQKFYEQYDFSRVSEVYLEDGIPHVEMVKGK
ncbi:GNAT family N-acetyltransferase [Candidatus Nitronereus thalassa]|uniref:GNAT family N-acetyltransferase n=1 Tax=Candidatus Nitronereus thalassa TaxID=3020898 RepID=UPI003B969696